MTLLTTPLDPPSTHTPTPHQREVEQPRGSGAAASLAIATTLAGLSAGFFFTYQISVTRGLAIVDDTTYVESFQAINATVRNAPFAVVFFGTVPAIGIAMAMLRSATRATRALLTTALILAIAVVVITFAGSVPLNEELALVTDLDQASDARATFETTWNRLNLARTIASIGAAGALATAAVGFRPNLRT